jgi:LysM repeat protein
MEDDINESNSSMLPIALAVLAIALGGAGLYFGMTANQRLNPLSEDFEASSGSSARIEKQLSSVEAKLTELSAQNDELKQTVSRLRVYSSQSEQAAKQAMSGVKANRDEMVKLVEKINGMTTSGLRPQAAAAAAAATSARPSIGTNNSASSVTVTSGASNPSASSSASTYSIQSGDNFAKVASKKGISLQALLDANPGVNPRSLQIGQTITIPAN